MIDCVNGMQITNEILINFHRMAQSKLNDLAGKFSKGGPPGMGLGIKLLGIGGALVYGAAQSMYTGKQLFFKNR